MAMGCVAVIRPLDPNTGRRVEIRVSSVSSVAEGRLVNGLGGMKWEPAITQAPQLRQALWNGDFQAAVDTATVQLPINMGMLLPAYPDADCYYWPGAPITVHADRIGRGWPWKQMFTGFVATAECKGRIRTLSAAVDIEPFNVDALPKTYAGTGDAEGGTDIRNRVKPLVIGWARNVEPMLIDAVNAVYQFSAYGPIEAVSVLYERGSDFGPPVADHADYAALVAATIPPGRWATCLAAGLIRLGAPAFGVITGDIRGHCVGTSTPRLSGQIIAALAEIAGVEAARLDAASLTELDTRAPFPINMVMMEKEPFIDRAKAIALACNFQAGVGLDGRFFVTRINLSAEPILTVDAQGRRMPQVVDAEEGTVSVPYKRTIMGAGRCWRVHSADEIAFTAELVDRGAYSSSETYREGNVVDVQDGSRWLYINPVATAGNAPPAWPTASDAYWENHTPPSAYADGTLLDDLKPAQAGADVTGSNTAADTMAVATDPAASVADGAAKANAGLEADGTVTADKVLTDSMVVQAVSSTFTFTGGMTTFSDASGEVSVGSLIVTDLAVGDTMRVIGHIPVESDNDLDLQYRLFCTYPDASTAMIHMTPHKITSDGAASTKVAGFLSKTFTAASAGDHTFTIRAQAYSNDNYIINQPLIEAMILRR